MDKTKPQHRVLVIGGTGGIGQAMTRLLLDKGHLVIASYRDNSGDRKNQLDDLLRQHPDQLQVIPMDISRQETIETAFSDIRQQTDRLHWVINCTGLLHERGSMQPEKRVEDTETDQLQQSFIVNAIGPLLIARFALPLLKHEETSVLANLSARVGSISDNRLGGWYGYRASKAAQNMITRTLSIEFRHRSPNTVKPGLLKTPEEAVSHLYTVMKELTPEDSGKVLAWDGKVIPA